MQKIFKEDFSSGLAWLLGVYFLFTIGFMLIRIIFLAYYQGDQLSNIPLLEIFTALITGFRFDSVVTCFALIIPFLLLIILHLFTDLRKTIHYFRNFLKAYSIIVFICFIFICLVDFFYYKFFQYHINILFFGILDDDTQAVLSGIWTDYPVVKVFLGMIILYFFLNNILNRIFKYRIAVPIKNTGIELAVMFGIIGLFTLGLRGSIGLFPLHYEDSIISENAFVNSLTLNGVFALKNALKERKNQTIHTEFEKTISKYGYQNASDAIREYLNQTSQKEYESKDLLIETSEDTFLQKHPPNVVFIQMESFSNYYLDLHNEQMNLLGRLESQLPLCTIFRNFLSSTSGTIHSLESLLTGTPLTPISQSTYMDCPLSSSVAKIYSDAGYQTSFITSAALGWRNMDRYTLNQGFQLAEGSEVLLKTIPGTEKCDWGVFDESMFNRILQRLHEQTSKPHFIYGLTTTNHPPFQRPKHYSLYPLNIPDSLKKLFKVSEELAFNNFANYQYANDCLGRFIESIKNSNLGENTIIAASGDHNTLQVFNYEDTRLLPKHSVPFILYIPEKYKKFKDPDTKVFGSHKDVFPTLFSISLSNKKYLRTGVNLMDSAVSKNNFGIINYSLCMNNDGIVRFEHDPIYYRWESQNHYYNSIVSNSKENSLSKLLNQARAYCASMCYYIQSDLKSCKE